jgi:signal transduction histidine kinase/CheY-like chemotaxis protein
LNFYKIIGLLCLILIGAPSLGNSISKQASIEIKHTQYLVEGRVQYEFNRVLELDESRWQRAEDFPFNLGVLKKGAWLKFELVNVEPVQIERILEVANPRLHHLDIYVIFPNKPVLQYRLGSSLPFLERPIISRNFAIPLALEEQQSIQVYLRAESRLGVYVPLHLHQEKKFWQLAIAENIGQGLYFGILFMFVVFNLGLYLLRNDTLHLILAVDLSVFSLMYANYLGLNFEYLWPLDPQFNYLASLFFSYLVVVSANVFTWNFVSLSSAYEDSDKINVTRGFYYGFNALAIIGLILLWFIPSAWSSYFCAALVLGVAYYLCYLCYLSFRNQDAYAGGYLFTYGLAALATTVYVANKLALLPSNMLVLNSLGCSMLLQALILTCVLLERKKTSERVLALHQDSSLIPHSLRDWVAQFSHEIRTPLNGIIGMADLLKETPLNPTQYSYVRNLSSSGEHLIELVSDVLDYETLVSNQVQLVEADFNLADLCQQSIDLFIRMAQEHNVKVELIFEQGMPLDFHADSKRLRQILINLLNNSLKFTKNGSVVVRASYSSDKTLRLQVWDDGIGMTKQQQKDVFKRFRQADSSVYQRFGGNGLGLAICEQLATLMSGSLSVESTLAEYCCFTLILPMGIARQKEKGQVEKSVLFESKESDRTDATVGFNSFSGRLKILGVDDNKINRTVLKAMLSMLGHTVIEACNGQEAIDVVCSGLDIDLIIMDCEMPIMNGFAATREIRQWQYGQADKNCRIIALTAHTLEEHKDKCLEAGMDGHLSKPLHLKELRELIEQLAS